MWWRFLVKQPLVTDLWTERPRRLRQRDHARLCRQLLALGKITSPEAPIRQGDQVDRNNPRGADTSNPGMVSQRLEPDGRAGFDPTVIVVAAPTRMPR